ncbi:hypothetical protein OIV83_005340 [Microbotryomycetes sp. JL201]|nr:hypothetical protein OIV83_005340 [Microbotryomycetes sp. JL201]
MLVNKHSSAKQLMPLLPSELVLYILEIATEPVTREPTTHQNLLANVALVSKSIAQWSQQRLYDSPFLTSTKQMDSLRRTVSRNPGLRKLVRHVTVDGLDRSTRLVGFRLNVTRTLPKLLDSLFVDGTASLDSLTVSNALILSMDDFALSTSGESNWLSQLKNLAFRHTATQRREPINFEIRHVVFRNSAFVDSRPGRELASTHAFSNTTALTLDDTCFSPCSAKSILSAKAFNKLSLLHVINTVKLVSDPLLMRPLGTFDFHLASTTTTTTAEHEQVIEKHTRSLLEEIQHLKLSTSSKKQDRSSALEFQKQILVGTAVRKESASLKRMDVPIDLLFSLSDKDLRLLLGGLQELTMRDALRHAVDSSKRRYEWTDKEVWVDAFVKDCVKNGVALGIK